MTDIAILEHELMRTIDAAADEAELEAARVAALGKRGSISALLATLGKMSPDERKQQGPLINGLKDRVSDAVAARREVLRDAALERRLNTEAIDVTLPAPEPPADIGRIHPISQVMDEVTAIFADMGFAVAEGPDVETDDYNFTKLNFPVGHPAREMHDTFFFNQKPDGSRLLLRTHTSPVQVRTMLAERPPIRVICPGRTYRRDSDQTHTPMFHQVEGLIIDEASHLGHLKWILAEFCKAFFEVDDVKMRFRPSFFPFTEPSLEVDIQCRRDKARSASARVTTGSKSLAAAWCIRTCCEIAASTLTGTRDSHGAWGSIASPCSNTACTICALSSSPTCAGSRTTASGRSIFRRWREG